MKLKPWATLEELPGLINKVNSRLPSLDSLVDKVSGQKRPAPKVIKSLEKVICTIEEDRNLIENVVLFENALNKNKIQGRILTEIDQLNHNLILIYKKLSGVNNPQFANTKNFLYHRVQSSDYNLISKSVSSVFESYQFAIDKLDANNKKFSQELCFMTFQSVAGFYRYLENKEDSFLIRRLGVEESEDSIIGLAASIRELGKESIKKFLTGRESLDDLSLLPDLKLRTSFDESKLVIQKFFTEIHPRMGEIAKQVLKESTYISNNVSSFYTVEAYRRLPKIIVKASPKLEYELALVHELAHAIHFTLQAENNPVTNTDINTLTMEYVPSLFELLFLFSEYKKEARPRQKKKILEFIIHHIAVCFYSGALNVELENSIWVHIGDKLNTPQKLSKHYFDLCKSYSAGAIDLAPETRDGWIYYHNIFDPQLDASYLLSFIYAYHSFIKFQSFRLSSDGLLNFLKKGSEADMNEIIPLKKLLQNPGPYIKEIINSIAEYQSET